MPQQKLQEVLENVIALTSEKDSSALELALAHTLFTLADVKNVVIHSASNINRKKYASANADKSHQDLEIHEDISDALNECLESAAITYTKQAEKELTLFPLLCAKKQPLAVVILEAPQKIHDHDLTIMILKIYHNFITLMNDNERDTLTGLLNRKTFDLKINSIISELQNNQKRRKNDSDDPSYLAIFDIDHFKRVNDTYGHLMGDEVLLLFSHMMDKNFRGEDLLFRFGGEEFVGVFQCPPQHIERVLNRFRKEIEAYNFPQVGKVTVSCGFTKIDAFDLSSNIIGRADASLYYAKNNGRNQLHQHEQLIATGALTQSEHSTGEIELF